MESFTINEWFEDLSNNVAWRTRWRVKDERRTPDLTGKSSFRKLIKILITEDYLKAYFINNHYTQISLGWLRVKMGPVDGLEEKDPEFSQLVELKDDLKNYSATH